MERHISVLEKKIDYYVEQQSLFQLMRAEIDRYKQEYDTFRENTTLHYLPFTPKRQDTVLTQGKFDIVDLSEPIAETKK
jgi:hypothetical protein